MTVTVSQPKTTTEWPEQGMWTYEDWLRLPTDGTRYEVIDGVLYMTPAPSVAHQDASGSLFAALRAFLHPRGGKVFAGPVDVLLPGQPVPLEPDLVAVTADRREIIGVQSIAGAPDLVVEILSPSNWMYDRNEKFAVYRTAGVPEYWIVDYRAKTIEVFVLESGEYVLLGLWASGETAASRVLDGFTVAVDEVLGGP
jgi:Uma2 family endonuclease